MQTDTSDPDITDEDRDHDYLGVVLQTIPFLRNHYAHGTSALDDKSLSALRLASEIINQIFPRLPEFQSGSGAAFGVATITAA